MALSNSNSTIILDYPREEVFNAVRDAVYGFGNMGITSMDEAQGIIKASTGVSVTSWGENILAEIRPLPDNRTELRVTSGTKFGLDIFGRNNRIASRIIQSVRERLEKNAR